MKFKKLLLIIPLLFVPVATTLGDSVVGEPVVILGHDLTAAQKKLILKEMNVPENTKTLEVTNEEEHRYLGGSLSKAMIGTRAISSARIILLDKGQGIAVKTHNISSITDVMYASAATTAGVKDADIYVTAPFKVSGTAGLTGIVKAFEKATGKTISENQKKVANEEVVRTSEIAKQAGDTGKAVQFVNQLKEAVSKQDPQTPEEYKQIINNVANNLGITLTAEMTNNLVKFCTEFAKLDIDWNTVSQQVAKFSDQLNQAFNDAGFWESLKSWCIRVSAQIRDLFSNMSW